MVTIFHLYKAHKELVALKKLVLFLVCFKVFNSLL